MIQEVLNSKTVLFYSYFPLYSRSWLLGGLYTVIKTCFDISRRVFPFGWLLTHLFPSEFPYKDNGERNRFHPS